MMSIWPIGLSVHLSRVCKGFCWILFVFPVNSCAFAMHQNWTLSGIIFQSCSILCVLNGQNWILSDICLSCEYAMSNLFVSLLDILIASNQPYWDFRYCYKLALECGITFIVSIWIGIWVPYYFYHKSLIWHLNAIFIVN